MIAPPPEDFFDPEPVIETEVMPDNEDQQAPGENHLLSQLVTLLLGLPGHLKCS